jgi:hypothetical protein
LYPCWRPESIFTIEASDLKGEIGNVLMRPKGKGVKREVAAMEQKKNSSEI